MILLSTTKGKDAIRRFKQRIKMLAIQLKGISDEGILSPRYGMFDWVDQMEAVYGAQITGSALEMAQDKIEWSIDKLYYDTPYYLDLQDNTMDQFFVELAAYIDEAEADAEKLAEEEKSKAEKKRDTEKAYKRERAKLQRLIRSREKQGVVSPVKVPKVPKKITEGSVKRIGKLIEQVKAKTPYVAKRGYVQRKW